MRIAMTDDARRPADRFIPWYFALAMIVVVAVNGALVFFATRSWSGLTTGQAYESGLAYNRVLDEATRQEALGWNFAVAVEGSRGGSRLVLRATDNAGRPLTDLRLALERPLGLDPVRDVEIRPAGGEVYEADLPSLASGQWVLRLVATRGADQRNLTQRLNVP
jgi:nitrogen fixation protein FixH